MFSSVKVRTNEELVFETTLKSYMDSEESFTYLMQIKDLEDITVNIAWLTGEIAKEERFNTGLSWLPRDPGDYTVEIFVWKSLIDPTPLAFESISTTVIVS